MTKGRELKSESVVHSGVLCVSRYLKDSIRKESNEAHHCGAEGGPEDEAKGNVRQHEADEVDEGVAIHLASPLLVPPEKRDIPVQTRNGAMG